MDEAFATMISAAPRSATELLERLAGSDPQIRLIAEVLKLREGAHPRPRPDPGERTAEYAGRYERLRHAYAALLEWNAVLAEALGACPRCWGDESACERCGGVGRPGAYAPDAALFRHYILPAVQRFKSERRAEAVHVGDRGRETTNPET